jgi:hypothetical protein
VSAVEIARLANIALADIGIGPIMYATDDHHVRWPLKADRDGMAPKAARLAHLKVSGPSRLVRCDDHIPARSQCGGVPVADALMGRTCGAS